MTAEPVAAARAATTDAGSDTAVRLQRAGRVAVRYARDVAIGAVFGALAVLLRWSVGLPPEILPFFTVVIAVCMVTVATGVAGGLTTMFLGGLLSWYFILGPHGWSLEGDQAYSLIGYFAVTSVILLTSQLYRASEQKRQAAALTMALREAEHQRLFAREMSHRLKNAIAIVQAMAGQTFPRDTPEVAKFDGRLTALAAAHNLLNEHVKQPTALVREVVETAVQPFSERPERFRLRGPDVSVPDQLVVSLSLALHELATNAVKYGALSSDAGSVSIDWSDAEGKLRLEWKEHDGPPVKAPSVQGFGARLLARAAMGADLRFEPGGLRCIITQRY
ncbi:MAG TPA: HWE histidine kinase domain-containing protein [Sphingomicrobium sp.]|nr:HWE histidine kinase domain-containing protein [Sphingomicrobium sp.]